MRFWGKTGNKPFMLKLQKLLRCKAEIIFLRCKRKPRAENKNNKFGSDLKSTPISVWFCNQMIWTQRNSLNHINPSSCDSISIFRMHRVRQDSTGSIDDNLSCLVFIKTLRLLYFPRFFSSSSQIILNVHVQDCERALSIAKSGKQSI